MMEYLETMLSDWNTPKDITYPTPPYIRIRVDLGPIEVSPSLPKRQFIDMRKKFDLNDISYVSFGTREDEETKLYVRKKDSFSAIRDSSHKYFVYEHDHLKAEQLQGDNNRKKETFKISSYAPMEGEKIPVTLKLKKSNKYLSYKESQFTLQTADEKSLKNIGEDNMNFLFFQNHTDKTKDYFSLEAATAPQSYLSTAMENGSDVTVEHGPVNSREIIFSLDSSLFGRLLNVAPNRISLNPLRNLTRLRSFDNSNSRYLFTNEKAAIGFWSPRQVFAC